MSRVVGVDPLDPDDLTRAEVEARAQVMQAARVFRRDVPGFARGRASPRRRRRSACGSRPHRRRVHAHRRRRPVGARLRRRRRAQRVPDRHPQSQRERNHDAPACRPVRPTRSRIAAWSRLLVDDLLVAGRCISTTHEALASTRLDADGDDARASRRHRGRPLAARGRDARARSTRGCLRERLIRDGVDLRRAEASVS